MSRVGVVFGGRSVEHEVSIVTAHQIMEVLAASHTVVPIYIARDGRWFTGDALNDLDVYRSERWEQAGEEAYLPPSFGFGGLLVPGSRLKGSRKVALDVVVPAIHGTYGEDGTLQGVLELAGIPYAGSGVAASAVGMDKVAMKTAFRGAGLPLVPDVLIDLERSNGLANGLDAVAHELGFPAFVKPVKAGSSVGIGKARDAAALAELVDVAGRYDTRVLVEKSMENCIEINCSVLGGGGREPRASVCEQPLAWEDFLSFEDKYMRGSKGGGSDEDRAASSAGGAKSPEGMASLERRIPAPISEELTKQIQENAVTAFRAAGASGVARIDSFLNTETGQTWVMEINTVPGSFAFYLWEASGMSFPELADELLAIAHDRHRAVAERLFTFESGMLDASRSGSKQRG